MILLFLTWLSRWVPWFWLDIASYPSRVLGFESQPPGKHNSQPSAPKSEQRLYKKLRLSFNSDHHQITNLPSHTLTQFFSVSDFFPKVLFLLKYNHSSFLPPLRNTHTHHWLNENCEARGEEIVAPHVRIFHGGNNQWNKSCKFFPNRDYGGL